jgi:glutamine amidotransferase
MTAIIDYRAGNLTSVRNALAALGAAASVTNDPADIRAADHVIFPGVGAAKSAMENLASFGLVDTLREVAASGKPFLGICLGMQILFEHSEEDGGVDLLGVLPGKVRRFPDVPGFKVPEIGWNQVQRSEFKVQSSELSGREFYFVHSYYAELGPYTVGRTEYAGIEFTSMVRKGALLACQFHPEKSGRIGLELLKEFLSC